MNDKKYTAKIDGRGKLKLYGETPKFFCVLDIDGIGEKKSMITVSNCDINGWGNLISSNDHISSISKGDTISFMFNDDEINKEWLNINSLYITILDNSGTKKWKEGRELYKKQTKEQCESELERKREKRKIEKEKRDKVKKELYKKYQQWYLEEYISKTTGANILLMYKTLNNIKNSRSLIGVRGKKAFLNDGSWVRPIGLYANVFHGLNQNIVNKALKELTEKKFVEYKLYRVITRDPYTLMDYESKQKGIQITEKGKIFLTNFESRKNKK